MSVTATPHVDIVGSGPNGLTAAAILACAGWQVRFLSAMTRSVVLRLPLMCLVTVRSWTWVQQHTRVVWHRRSSGTWVCEDYGLEWLHSEYPMAHPFDDRPAAILHRDVRKTARSLGTDQSAWRD